MGWLALLTTPIGLDYTNSVLLRNILNPVRPTLKWTKIISFGRYCIVGIKGPPHSTDGGVISQGIVRCHLFQLYFFYTREF